MGCTCENLKQGCCFLVVPAGEIVVKILSARLSGLVSAEIQALEAAWPG